GRHRQGPGRQPDRPAPGLTGTSGGAACPRRPTTRGVPMAEPRTRRQRRQDTLARLDTDVDLWVATAGATPHLIPLSFLWDGATLLISTPEASPTGRNLRATGRVRLGFGPTRDVVLIEATADAVPAAEIPPEVGDAFAVRTGFDPR